MESDAILNIMGNETRRKILAELARQPMYFNQLAKKVDIGQQAVLRHLQALEENGMVETYAEKSDLGAPERKYYKLSTSFILTVSLSADDFTVTHHRMTESRHGESRGYYERFDSLPEEAGRALSLLQDTLEDVVQEISGLEARLNDLRALRQLILHRLHEIGQEVFAENERLVLYRIVEESPKSVSELSDLVDVKESDLKSIIGAMKNKVDRESARILFGNLRG